MPKDEILIPSFRVTADINYFEEDWTDEYDFSFIDDKYYEISQEDFSAFVVSPTVKARFKFPARGPLPKSIVDTRSDAQIVSDILRVRCQHRVSKLSGMILHKGI